jgi:hypothetical protein
MREARSKIDLAPIAHGLVSRGDKEGHFAESKKDGHNFAPELKKASFGTLPNAI